MKKCTKCYENKELTSYYSNSSSLDGLTHSCKECIRNYRILNDKKIKITLKKYREKNKQNIKNYSDHNPNKLKIIRAKYYLNNKIELIKKHQKYCELNRGIVNAKYAKRRASKLNATPKWLNLEHLKEIKNIYIQAKELEGLDNIKRHVDHCIPLQGETVCGLHVPWNLQILTAEENLSKTNNLNQKVY